MNKLNDIKDLRNELYDADAVTMKGVAIINKFLDINNEPLTYEELLQVAESEEYGSHIWVKELIEPYDIIACVTDIYFGEVIAIWATDEWYSGEYYGETWLAYRYKPDKDGAK